MSGIITPQLIAGCLTDKVLALTLLPTEQCNFRCSYCYEDFAIGKMSNEVVQGIKRLISIRMPEIKLLSVEWFGGEPLSAKNIVYDISEHITSEIKGHDIHYVSGMTTNAFQLSIATFQKLLNYGVRTFQISLDGPKDMHNKTRVRIDGSGSFDQIWNNLSAIHQLEDNFKIILRIHVTPENYQQLKQFIIEVNDKFVDDDRFCFFFKAIANLGGDKGGTFDVLTGQTKREVLTELGDLVGDEKNYSLGNSSTPYICYAAKPNNLVIRANGTLAKCTVAFTDDRNNLGKITADGKIQLDPDKLSLWTRGIKSLDKNELHCPVMTLPELPKTQFKSIPIEVLDAV